MYFESFELSSAGFSLWELAGARMNPRRLKPALLNRPEMSVI